jgi:hypothetical protein
MVGAVEGGLALRAWHRQPQQRGAAYAKSSEFFEANDYLGYRPSADAEMKDLRINQDGSPNPCVYTTDAYHRRNSVVARPEERDAFAVFFGGSFTFGEGVNDDETLPSQFAVEGTQFLPYNYGFWGYGPQVMYLYSIDETFYEAIRPKRGIIVYTYINDHIDRATGATRIISNWGRRLPHLTVEDDNIVHHGTFEESLPYRSFLFSCIKNSHIWAFVRNRIPPPRSDQDFAITAGIINAAAKNFEDLFESVEFYLLIYQGMDKDASLMKHIDTDRVTCLDYSGLFVESGVKRRLLSFTDGHPTARGYEIVASHLSTDIARHTTVPVQP